MLAEDLGWSPIAALKSVAAPAVKIAASTVPGGSAAYDLALKAYKAGKGPKPTPPKPAAAPAKKPFPIGLVIVGAGLLGFLVLRKS